MGRFRYVTLAVLLCAGVVHAARPLWRYHNPNTLLGHPHDYQRGYTIGVIDGYLAAQERRGARAEDGDWLDRCLAAGWTTGQVESELRAYLDSVVAEYRRPAADLLLDGLRRACER
jgi:hypothetical protein